MGFLIDTQVHRQLMADMWRHVTKEQTETVNVQNLKVFLSAVMYFDYPWMKVKVETSPRTDEEVLKAEQTKGKINS